MKKLLIKLLTGILISLPFLLLAENPAPPPPGGHGASGNQPPVGAPIDGGLGILIAMGAAYGGYKYKQERKRRKKEQVTVEEETTVQI